MKSGKLLIFLATLALLLGVLAASVYATPPGLDTDPRPAGQDAPDAALGTAPAGAGIMNVGSSTVTGVNPNMIPPGSTVDLCFTVFVQSPDAEYMDHLDIDLPDNWIVNSVAANSVPPANGCSGALPPVVGVNAGNVVYWQSTGYPPQTGCGAWNGSTGGASFDFCTNVTVPDCSGEPWSFPWNYIGDGYGGTPHSVAGTAGPAGCLQPGVYLMPEAMPAEGCSGAPQVHTFQLLNNTGADGNFGMTYSVPTANGTLTGPPVVQAASGATVPFDVILTPNQCLDPGNMVVGLIEAAGNGYTDQSIIDKTLLSAFWSQIASEPNNGRMDNVVGAWNDLAWSITGYGADANVRTYDPATDTWADVGTPAPFGVNYVRSGCQFNDVVVMYGDAATAGFTGLWAYDMGALLWNNLTPSGTPPPQTGIWAPAWAPDPETGYCYMTGGATTAGAGNLTTVYVYDPGGNAWLAPLPSFTSARDFHAAFVFFRPADNHKLLCVVGGNNGAGMTSTQCYDFVTGAWNAENADMGALPTSLWGMGYAVKRHAGTEPQLWLTGGVNADLLSTATQYYDVNTGTWQPGGALVSGAVYRTAAVTLNNEIYHLGGSVGSFTYTGLADHHIQCPLCLYQWEKYIDGIPWTPQMEITRQTSDTIEVVEVLHLTPQMPPASSTPITPVDVEGQGGNPSRQVIEAPAGVTARTSGPVSPAKPLNPDSVLWDQPIGTTGYGGVSGYNTSGLFGAYSADDFQNAVPWAIDTIFVDGFDQAANLLRATSLTWYIYPDAGGVPAGYPGDGLGAEIWSLSLPPTDPAVTIGLGGHQDVTLNVALATGGPLNLPPGHYWLVFYPSLDWTSGLYYWYFAGTANLNHPQLIDPSNYFGAGFTSWTDWTLIDPTYTDIAFRLEGTESQPGFAQIETWDPTKLRLLDWAATGGDVIVQPDRVVWTGEIVAPMTITLTKWFHVEPCTWTETVLWEELWLGQVQVEQRPVLIHKLPPVLWIDTLGGGPVFAGQEISFTLLYGNTGGNENNVWIRNDFPPEAPFVSSVPPATNVDPNHLWAEWEIGDLPQGASGSIDVTVMILPTVPPSTTIEIWDYIFDHIGEPRDSVSILFHVEPPPLHRVYLPLIVRDYTP